MIDVRWSMDSAHRPPAVRTSTFDDGAFIILPRYRHLMHDFFIQRYNQYESEGIIGTGFHSKVKQVRDVETGIAYAMKVMKKAPRQKSLPRFNAPGGSDPHLEKIYAEIEIFKSLDHPNLIQLHEIIDDPERDKIYLVTELMVDGAWDEAAKYHQIPIRTVFIQILRGLEYLHSRGIVHRDIKPQNVLCNVIENEYKLGDFGSAVQLRNGPGTAPNKSDAAEYTEQSHSAIAPRPPSLHDDDDDQETSNPSDLDRRNEAELAATTVGTPAFFAPEMISAYEHADNDSNNRHRHNNSKRSLNKCNGLANGRPSHEEDPHSTPNMSDNPLPHLKPLYRPGTPSSPPIGRGIDIWALGVSLYMMEHGFLPFSGAREWELYNAISSDELRFPETPDIMPTEEWEEIVEMRDLLGKMLQKNPLKRVTLREIKNHPWVLRGEYRTDAQKKADLRGHAHFDENPVRVQSSPTVVDTTVNTNPTSTPTSRKGSQHRLDSAVTELRGNSASLGRLPAPDAVVAVTGPDAEKDKKDFASDDHHVEVSNVAEDAATAENSAITAASASALAPPTAPKKPAKFQTTLRRLFCCFRNR
ncbi:kinase-like domain-containing protein [Fimicolochytrium jonesii]|uniref:kinase-like domain-containing protein n=1 Tax=Fimicolochytrium jonesii TaxID=1396493 RepID=UPI0022FF2014|nr:kinase-like domain-containing protein [Fimicolochytrium jonesii]KAI8820455.1 kinase-like domain-containing protein [Fimicolochytrium jonesii]